jgi:hypothetical protein
VRDIPLWLTLLAIAVFVCILLACEVHMPLSGVGKTEIHQEAASSILIVDEKKPADEPPAK